MQTRDEKSGTNRVRRCGRIPRLRRTRLLSLRMKGTVRAMYNPQLDTFLCVVESGSFNKAAEKLYISPPAVIKQINLLEEGLDLQLFVRTHRGLQLTKCGKIPLSGCQIHHPILQDSVTRAKNAMQKTANVIRIGTSPMTPAQVLVDLWPKLQEDCPGIKFQLVPFDNTPENARGDPGQSGTEHRCGCGHLRRDDAESAPVRRIGDFQEPSAVQYPSTTGWPRKNG